MDNKPGLETAIALLAADGPYAGLADKLMLFGQFVGSWDLESVEYIEGGTRNSTIEWHFAWVLGGRGVQDVIFDQGAPPHERGTTLRGYDERTGVWHVTYMHPSVGRFINLVARATDDGIVLENSEVDRMRRWSFSDIKPDSFVWRGHFSFDGGATWDLRQVMHAKRRSGR
jgi:hypothetical protein